METIRLVFLVLAFVCFLLATFNVPSKINLVAAGLCCWIATIIPGLIR